jgi:glycosyltransferase involved in cell wall biosynthesis
VIDPAEATRDDGLTLLAPEQSARVIALIPAYNEERCIGSVILRARAYVDDVIVVDDGSRDATARVAEAAGAQLIRHSENRGKGQALTTGFRAARKLRPDVLVILDSDGQHSADEIPLLVAAMREQEADMVVGSRFRDAEQLAKIPHGRRMGLRAVTTVTNVLSGVHVSDSQSGFRAFSARALNLLTFRGAGFSVESEMQFLAREHGLNIVEVSISADYEDPAKRSPVVQGLGVLNGVLRLVGQTRPLLFMGVPGLLALMLGVFMGLAVVSIYITSEKLAVGYALISVLCMVMGTMSLFSGIILHSVRALLLSMLRPNAVAEPE